MYIYMHVFIYIILIFPINICSVKTSLCFCHGRSQLWEGTPHPTRFNTQHILTKNKRRILYRSWRGNRALKDFALLVIVIYFSPFCICVDILLLSSNKKHIFKQIKQWQCAEDISSCWRKCQLTVRFPLLFSFPIQIFKKFGTMSLTERSYMRGISRF